MARRLKNISFKKSRLANWILILLETLILLAPCAVPAAELRVQDRPSDWGEAQLTLVVQDRPQLQPFVQKGNQIWNWLANAFASTPNGINIHWDNGPTSNFFPSGAECGTALNGKRFFYVRVDSAYKTKPADGGMRSGEDVLYCLVFELNNVRHSEEKEKIYNEAESGSIQRTDFIRSIAEIEYRALSETAAFYSDVWIPFCKTRGFHTDPSLWGMPVSTTFEKWLTKYSSTSWYPWQCYGNIFDWISAQREGDLKLSQGDWAGAIANYTKRLKLEPHPYPLYCRAVAEMLNGDQDSALADLHRRNELVRNDPPFESYGQLIVWYIQVQKGRKADADHDLSKYFLNRPAAVSGDWYSKIAAFLLDRINESDLMRAAISSDLDRNQDQRSEAWCFLGMKSLVKGDKPGAIDYFHKCMAENRTHSDEYILARSELEMLGGDGGKREQEAFPK